ncbi:MAG TPA: 3'-5' exonuclease, partial [Desulfobacterales bacterium]|nr:3'-5' exonuclease [Desulfobacterales bacterium]
MFASLPLFAPLRRLLRPPHPVLQENRRLFEHFSQGQPIGTYDYVVLDSELTGLNRRRDEIVAIGAVRIRNLRIVLADAFYSLVRPKDLTPNEATLIHRLTPEELAAAPPIEEVLP